MDSTDEREPPRLKPIGRFEWERAVRSIQAPTGPGRRRVAAIKSFALAYATYANGDGGSLYPSARRLAEDLGREERSVRQRLGDLRALGLVERVRGGNRRQGAADEYRLTVPVEGLPTRISSFLTTTAVVSNRNSTPGMETRSNRNSTSAMTEFKPELDDAHTGTLALSNRNSNSAHHVLPRDQPPPPEPAVAETSAVNRLVEVVEISLQPHPHLQVGRAYLFDLTKRLHAGGWTPAALQARLGDHFWDDARGGGLVRRKLQDLAADGPPRVAESPDHRPAVVRPECDRCFAAEGAPLSERTIEYDNGSVGPCPACRPESARRSA